MESTINFANSGAKLVSELVNEKGKIFSLIKEGYEFEDEVLYAANIKRSIRDVKFDNVVMDKNGEKDVALKKDTASARQIISEMNSNAKCMDEVKTDGFDSYNNEIDFMSFDYGDDEE